MEGDGRVSLEELEEAYRYCERFYDKSDQAVPELKSLLEKANKNGIKVDSRLDWIRYDLLSKKIAMLNEINVVNVVESKLRGIIVEGIEESTEEYKKRLKEAFMDDGRDNDEIDSILKSVRDVYEKYNKNDIKKFKEWGIKDNVSIPEGEPQGKVSVAEMLSVVKKMPDIYYAKYSEDNKYLEDIIKGSLEFMDLDGAKEEDLKKLRKEVIKKNDEGVLSEKCFELIENKIGWGEEISIVSTEEMIDFMSNCLNKNLKVSSVEKEIKQLSENYEFKDSIKFKNRLYKDMFDEIAKGITEFEGIRTYCDEGKKDMDKKDIDKIGEFIEKEVNILNTSSFSSAQKEFVFKFLEKTKENGYYDKIEQSARVYIAKALAWFCTNGENYVVSEEELKKDKKRLEDFDESMSNSLKIEDVKNRISGLTQVVYLYNHKQLTETYGKDPGEYGEYIGEEYKYISNEAKNLVREYVSDVDAKFIEKGLADIYEKVGNEVKKIIDRNKTQDLVNRVSRLEQSVYLYVTKQPIEIYGEDPEKYIAKEYRYINNEANNLVGEYVNDADMKRIREGLGYVYQYASYKIKKMIDGKETQNLINRVSRLEQLVYSYATKQSIETYGKDPGEYIAKEYKDISDEANNLVGEYVNDADMKRIKEGLGYVYQYVGDEVKKKIDSNEMQEEENKDRIENEVSSEGKSIQREELSEERREDRVSSDNEDKIESVEAIQKNFITAVRDMNTEKVKRMLNNANMEIGQDSKNIALYEIVRRGKAGENKDGFSKMTEILIDSGANVSEEGKDGNIRVASQEDYKNREILMLLLGKSLEGKMSEKDRRDYEVLKGEYNNKKEEDAKLEESYKTADNDAKEAKKKYDIAVQEDEQAQKDYKKAGEKELEAAWEVKKETLQKRNTEYEHVREAYDKVDEIVEARKEVKKQLIEAENGLWDFINKIREITKDKEVSQSIDATHIDLEDMSEEVAKLEKIIGFEGAEDVGQDLGKDLIEAARKISKEVTASNLREVKQKELNRDNIIAKQENTVESVAKQNEVSENEQNQGNEGKKEREYRYGSGSLGYNPLKPRNWEKTNEQLGKSNNDTQSSLEEKNEGTNGSVEGSDEAKRDTKDKEVSQSIDATHIDLEDMSEEVAGLEKIAGFEGAEDLGKDLIEAARKISKEVTASNLREVKQKELNRDNIIAKQENTVESVAKQNEVSENEQNQGNEGKKEREYRYGSGSLGYNPLKQRNWEKTNEQLGKSNNDTQSSLEEKNEGTNGSIEGSDEAKRDIQKKEEKDGLEQRGGVGTLNEEGTNKPNEISGEKKKVDKNITRIENMVVSCVMNSNKDGVKSYLNELGEDGIKKFINELESNEGEFFYMDGERWQKQQRDKQTWTGLTGKDILGRMAELGLGIDINKFLQKNVESKNVLENEDINTNRGIENSKDDEGNKEKEEEINTLEDMNPKEEEEKVGIYGTRIELKIDEAREVKVERAEATGQMGKEEKAEQNMIDLYEEQGKNSNGDKGKLEDINNMKRSDSERTLVDEDNREAEVTEREEIGREVSEIGEVEQEGIERDWNEEGYKEYMREAEAEEREDIGREVSEVGEIEQEGIERDWDEEGYKEYMREAEAEEREDVGREVSEVGEVEQEGIERDWDEEGYKEYMREAEAEEREDVGREASEIGEVEQEETAERKEPVQEETAERGVPVQEETAERGVPVDREVLVQKKEEFEGPEKATQRAPVAFNKQTLYDIRNHINAAQKVTNDNKNLVENKEGSRGINVDDVIYERAKDDFKMDREGENPWQIKCSEEKYKVDRKALGLKIVNSFRENESDKAKNVKNFNIIYIGDGEYSLQLDRGTKGPVETYYIKGTEFLEEGKDYKFREAGEKKELYDLSDLSYQETYKSTKLTKEIGKLEEYSDSLGKLRDVMGKYSLVGNNVKLVSGKNQGALVKQGNTYIGKSGSKFGEREKLVNNIGEKDNIGEIVKYVNGRNEKIQNKGKDGRSM